MHFKTQKLLRNKKSFNGKYNLAINNKTIFAKGDSVKVITGDYKSTTGRIIKQVSYNYFIINTIKHEDNQRFNSTKKRLGVSIIRPKIHVSNLMHFDELNRQVSRVLIEKQIRWMPKGEEWVSLPSGKSRSKIMKIFYKKTKNYAFRSIARRKNQEPFTPKKVF